MSVGVKMFFVSMNRYSESYREDLYMSVGEMKDKKLKIRNLHV